MRLRNFKGETKNVTTRVPNWYVVVLVFAHCYENYHSNPQGKVKGRERQRSQGQAVSIVFHLGQQRLAHHRPCLEWALQRTWAQSLPSGKRVRVWEAPGPGLPSCSSKGGGMVLCSPLRKLQKWVPGLSVSLRWPSRLRPYWTFPWSKEYLEIHSWPNPSKERSKEQSTGLALPSSAEFRQRSLVLYLYVFHIHHKVVVKGIRWCSVMEINLLGCKSWMG